MTLSGFAVYAATGDKAGSKFLNVDWATYEGTQGANYYSPLAQVTRAKVKGLGVAWTYDIGDSVSIDNPLIVRGVIYVSGKNGGAISSLDAATGREIWVSNRRW